MTHYVFYGFSFDHLTIAYYRVMAQDWRGTNKSWLRPLTELIYFRYIILIARYTPYIWGRLAIPPFIALILQGVRCSWTVAFEWSNERHFPTALIHPPTSLSLSLPFL